MMWNLSISKSLIDDRLDHIQLHLVKGTTQKPQHHLTRIIPPLPPVAATATAATCSTPAAQKNAAQQQFIQECERQSRTSKAPNRFPSAESQRESQTACYNTAVATKQQQLHRAASWHRAHMPAKGICCHLHHHPKHVAAT
jgi:hypothetical protein